MNMINTFLLAGCIILTGINRVLNIKKCGKALYEIIRFINLVKNNIRFSSMDYEGLVASGKNEHYAFIELGDINNKEIYALHMDIAGNTIKNILK